MSTLPTARILKRPRSRCATPAGELLRVRSRTGTRPRRPRCCFSSSTTAPRASSPRRWSSGCTGRCQAAGLRVLGVSQDDVSLTAAFAATPRADVPPRAGRRSCSSPRSTVSTPSRRWFWPTAAPTSLASFEGFGKADLRGLVDLAAERCGGAAPAIEREGESLPESRPGCGSKVHDPDVARRLAGRRDASKLAARRVRMPADLDPFEFLDQQGMTDGLPVVPPTEERVARMLAGTSRQPGRRGGRRAAEPGAGHGGEGRHQRRHGRLQAGISAGGDRRRRGGVHRRLQPARRAGHDVLRRAARHRQRTHPPRDRAQLRQERLRAGNARQRHHRARPAARGPQRRRRPPRRGVSTCRRSASRGSSAPASASWRS